MENSEKESDAQKSFSSPPRRRRSTFFERRDSIVPPPEVIDPIRTSKVDPNMCIKLNEVDEKHNQELKRYHDLLLAEKDHWKAEVKHRRNKYHDLRQQFQIASNAPSRSRISYSALTNEDIEFLKGKVNVAQLVEHQSNLHKSLLRTRDFYKRATDLDNVVLDYCEKKLSKITDYLLQNSTIDLKE